MLPEVFENFTTTGILLLTAIVICSIPILSYLRYLISSPGPWGLPILGYYPFLRNDYPQQLHELAKKHGDIYLINLAGQTFLYMDNIKAVREVHVNKGDCFSYRSDKHSLFKHGFGDGILFLKGEAWKLQRKFFVQSMKQIGLSANKEELTGPVGDAVNSTINTLLESKGEPVDINALLFKECACSVSRLFFGDDVSEEDVAKLSEAYLKVVAPMNSVDVLLTGTFARYFLLLRTPGYSVMTEGKKQMTDLLFKILEKHKEEFSVDQQPRDLIDLYLRERTLREKKGDPQAKHFTDSSLVFTLLQIYGDGSLSIAVLIAFFLLYLSQCREIQNQLFKEITQEVGSERLPTWEDRPKLPLTYSTIKELFRFSKVFEVFPDLECIEDTSVRGIRVPKGCITLLSFYAMYNDPTVYKNPEKFDPTRFMPGPSKEEDPPIFGLGKRSCIGEGMVMTELFIFLASLLQNFIFLPESETASIKSFEELLQGKIRAFPRFPKEKLEQEELQKRTRDAPQLTTTSAIFST